MPIVRAAKEKDNSLRFGFWALLLLFVAEYPRPHLLAVTKAQLLGLIVLGVLLLTHRAAIAKDKKLLALVLFTIVIAKSLLHCINHFSAFVATKAALGYLVILFGLAWVCVDDRYRGKLIDFWVALLAYCAVYGFLHNGHGPGAIMGDENDLALACAVGLSFALFGATTQAGLKRWLYAASVPLFLLGVIASQSRGGFLAAGSVMAYFFLRQRGLAKKILFPAIAAVMFVTFAPDNFKREIFSLEKDVQVADDADSTVSKRFYLWATGVNMFLDHPILGVGAQNYTWHVPTYQPRGSNWPPAFTQQDMAMQASHSMYIDVLSELGLPGVILWLYVMLTTLFSLIGLARKSAEKTEANESWRPMLFHSQALAGALVGYLAGGVSLAVAYYPYMWYIVGISIGLHTAVRRLEASEQQKDLAAGSLKNGVGTQPAFGARRFKQSGAY